MFRCPSTSILKIPIPSSGIGKSHLFRRSADSSSRYADNNAVCNFSQTDRRRTYGLSLVGETPTLERIIKMVHLCWVLRFLVNLGNFGFFKSKQDSVKNSKHLMPVAELELYGETHTILFWVTVGDNASPDLIPDDIEFCGS